MQALLGAGNPEGGSGEWGRAEEPTPKTGRGDQAWKDPRGLHIGGPLGQVGHFDLPLKAKVNLDADAPRGRWMGHAG